MAVEMVWLNGRVNVLEHGLALTEEHPGQWVLEGGASRIERSPVGDRGTLVVEGETYVLSGGLHPTPRGLVGRFVTPPGGAFVRERVALMLIPDPDDPILAAFGRDPSSDRPTSLVGWPMPTPLTRPRLLPRIVRGTPPLLARALDDQGDETHVTLATRPIGEDLAIVYVEDTDAGVRRLDVDAANRIEPDEAHRWTRALDNLAKLPLVRIVGDGPLFTVRRSGVHEAAFLLLETFWDAMAPLLDGPRMVAMPRHDVLIVTGDAGADRQQALREAAARYDTPHGPLSDALHRFDDVRQQWRLV
ncbi:MAG: hypothetical protein AAGA48_04835 [Myxococcota bacterium]